MPTHNPIAMRPGGELGALLRHWRDLRGKSQFHLSLDTGVSQRHISFIEIGRSAPSRQMLIDIATALDIPLRERNTLLLAGGYAPIYPEGAWDGPEKHSVTKALERILRQHEPFPALVMDRCWNVLMTNKAAPSFFGRFTTRPVGAQESAQHVAPDVRSRRHAAIHRRLAHRRAKPDPARLSEGRSGASSMTRSRNCWQPCSPITTANSAGRRPKR